MNVLPSWLIEVSNGVLFLLVLAMTAFALVYLVTKLRECGGTWMRVYVEAKAAIALMVFLIGVDIGVFVRWWFRTMQNHGIDPRPYIALGTTLVIVGTVVAIWGGMCWIKVITPVRFPRGTWFLVGVAAIAIATMMAF